ncbi:WD40 repeat domain-containing serine/threonine protein kinase [Actinomadura decatromicini]|uniref:non-specific serine/threonine protein kinase n=1 Tax=Actinomadura decatromicini TaxID=2604572 RepID=A0A5D3FZH9_9ACTN|nr:serine/threonine-protein kinase [Actinomadura decatromicini]TYK53418.1 protein kinase [Actinomadura decatromicini]
MSVPLEPGDPERLGEYWLAGRLGAGGQGVVFDAYAADGTRVAVKVFHTGDGKPADLRRMGREVAAAQRVSAFCTARVLDWRLDGARPYMVSEFVEGPSLARAVQDGRRFIGDDLHRLAVGIATALTAIHEAGVVHRDLKPGNILLGPDGPRVIDFGIARTLEMSVTPGPAAGTPLYMAPEQFRNGDVGPAADVFAWGAILLFGCTGDHPFRADNLSAVMHRVLTARPDVSVLPEALRPLVAAALAKDPLERPAARTLLAALTGGPAADASGLMAAGTAEAGLLARWEPTDPALGRVAEEAYLSLSAHDQGLVPEVFLRLVTIGDQGQLAPRAVAAPELPDGPRSDESEAFDRILAAFAPLITRVDARIVLSRPAVLRAWSRARDWLDRYADGLPGHQQIRRAARAWDDNGRRHADVLTGSILQEALLWAASHRRPALNRLERDFLDAGSRAQVRGRRRRRLVIGALMTLVLVAGAAGGAAEVQSRVAAGERGKVTAQRNRERARSLVAEADALRLTDPRTAMLLDAAAGRIAPHEAQVLAGLHDALTAPAVDAFTPPGADGGTQYALSGAGTTLVGVKDGTARLWDVSSARLTRQVSGIDGDVHVVALNGDATLLAVRDDDAVQLWNTVTGKRIGVPIPVGPAETLGDLHAGVLRFSADSRFLRVPGSTLAAGDWVNLRTRSRVRVGSRPVETLGPDGVFGAVRVSRPSSLQDGASPVQVWNLAEGIRRTLSGLAALTKVTDTLFSADGRRFAAVEEDQLHIWDLTTGRELPSDSQFNDSLDETSLSPDGSLLMVVDSDGVSVRAVGSGTEFARLPLTSVQEVAFSADGGVQRVLGADGTVITLRVGHPAAPNPTGTSALSGSAQLMAVVDRDRLVVREVATGRTLWSRPVLDLRALEGLGGLNAYGCLCAVAFSPDATKVAVGGSLVDSTNDHVHIAILNTSNGALLKSFPLAQYEGVAGVSSMAFSQDGHLLQVAPSQLGDEGVPKIASMELWSWQDASGTALRGMDSTGAAFHPDGSTLVTAGGTLIDVASHRRLRQLGNAQGAAFNRDGTSLAISGPSHITIWDTRTWRPLPVHLAAANPTTPVFSPDGRTLAALTDGGLQLWDLPTGRPLGAPIPGQYVDARFDRTGEHLHLLGENGTTHHTIPIAPHHLLAAVCSRAGRTLTRKEWHQHVPGLPFQNVCP